MDGEQIRRAFLNKIRGNQLLAAVLVVGLLALALPFLLIISSGNSSRHISEAHTFTSSSTPLDWNWDNAGLSLNASTNADRPVYPYSVIPGGVANAKELRVAVRQDPAVASHYADFRTQSARVVRLASPRHVYVSYRLGDHIYWTHKKVSLRAGEMLLTDGENFVRTRCGNRVSEVPVAPTSPSEPPTEVFNKPVGPQMPSPVPFPAGPLLEENPSPILLTWNPAPQPAPPFIPLIPVFPCCGGSRGTSPSPGPLPPPYPPGPPTPPVATPEPPSLVLLVVGLGALICFWRFRHS